MRKDWVVCNLDEVVNVLDNLRKPINSKEREKRILGKKVEELYPYYGATGLVGYIDDYLTDGEFVLIGEDAAPFYNPTKGLAYKIKGKTWVNNHAHILKPLINDDFILYYLNQFNYKGYVSGTTRLKLTQGSLNIIPVKVASIPEQRAIVKKIEALFSSLDAGIADLKKAQEQLKIYRQAVLKKAFEGELTKDWREKQTDLPTAEELKEDLKSLIDEALKNKHIAKGNYFPDYPNGSSGFNIPNKWNFFAIKSIVQPNKTSLKRGPFGSALKKEFFIEKGIPVYEQGHAINDEPFRHRYFISDEKYEELKGFMAGPNDLIISCSGATLGRICHLPENADTGIINQALLKISLNEKIILHKYFIIMFRSEVFQRLIFEKSLGTAMPNMVGMNELKDIAIPIPSIKEQAQIVKEIESRLSVCDAVEQQIKDSLSQAEALRQSILKKAFEGRLLSNEEIQSCQLEPDYEPAAVLLEKIKAEKEAHKLVKKSKKK